MNWFDKGMLWLIDKEPKWFSDSIDWAQDKLYSDGMSDVERDYKDALVRGENPTPPTSLPDHILDETREIARIEKQKVNAGKTPHDIIHSRNADLKEKLKNGDHEKMFPRQDYSPSADEKFDESKIGGMTIGEAKGYVGWAKDTGQVDKDYGTMEGLKKKGMKAG